MVDVYGTWKVNNIIGNNTEQDIGREKLKSPEIIDIREEALKGKGLADNELKNEEECNEKECNEKECNEKECNEEEGVRNVINRSEKNNHEKENIDLNVNKSGKKLEKTNTVQGKETEEDSVKNKSIANKKIDIMGDQINKSDIKLEVNPSESKEDPKNQNKKEENHNEERTNDPTANKNMSTSSKSSSKEKNEKLNNDPNWKISRAIIKHCWNKKAYYLSAIGLVVSYIIFKESIQKTILNLLGHTLEENSSYSSDSGWTKKNTYKKNWSWNSNSDSTWWGPKWDSDWANTNFKKDSNNDYSAWKDNPRYENYKQYFSSQSQSRLSQFCRDQMKQAHPDKNGKPGEFEKIASECKCLRDAIKTVSDNPIPISHKLQEVIIKKCIKSLLSG